MGNESNRFLMH